MVSKAESKRDDAEGKGYVEIHTVADLSSEERQTILIMFY